MIKIIQKDVHQDVFIFHPSKCLSIYVACFTYLNIHNPNTYTPRAKQNGLLFYRYYLPPLLPIFILMRSQSIIKVIYVSPIIEHFPP